MKWRGFIRWRAVGLLLAVLVIVTLPYAITRDNSRSTQLAIAEVSHSTAVKSQVFEVAYLMHDSQSAIYRLLVGDDDPQTRARAQRASREGVALMDGLRRMTRDNPDQQMRVGQLYASVSGRIRLMEQSLARLQKHDVAGARQSLRDAEDLFAINASAAAIVAHEDALLKGRRDAAGAQSDDSQLALTLSALAQLLLLIIIVGTSEWQVERRRRAEASAVLAVSRSQRILQSVPEPIGLFDANLRVLVVNAAFSEMYGLQGEFGGRDLVGIGDGAWSDDVLIQRLKDVLARDRELWDYDLTQCTADGVTRRVVVNACQLQQRANEPPALLLTVSDITARAMVEREINDLNRQLKGKVARISDVNRELESFSYSVSHDLRAPLRHISGFAQKLAQHLGDGIDDKSRHYLEVVNTAAQHMGMLIDDLLVFSRLGRGALRLQAVDMQSLVEEASALATVEVPDRHITWQIGDLPMVIGDENMLRTVWQNLISNAVKYTGQREVAHIGISATRDAAGNYTFTVDDNGAGFDMQYADKLFGVFQRLHRASEFPGNGIGLANVQRIIARHGGRIWAEAEPDQGAHFHFSLPATDPSGTPIKDKA